MAYRPTLSMGYQCAECKSQVRRNHFMPDMGTDGEVQRNWQGQPWGRCFACSMGQVPRLILRKRH
eukprot:2792940-Prorocentrum_lima.AAC.1